MRRKTACSNSTGDAPRVAHRNRELGKTVSRTPNVKAIDFCCGAGGLTCGLLDADVSVVAGLDNDERLRNTYEHSRWASMTDSEAASVVRFMG